MSVRISVDRESKLVVSTFGGTLTSDALLDGRAEVAKHPEFLPTFTHVLDFTDVTAVELDPQSLRDLAAMPSIFEVDAVQILVAPPASPMFKIAQLYKTIAAGTHRAVRIAENLREAHALVAALG